MIGILGCESQKEDILATGSDPIENLVFVPEETRVTLSWRNPTTSIQSIRITWVDEDGNTGSFIKTDELTSGGRASVTIDGLSDETRYTFFVYVLEEDGDISEVAEAVIDTGSNHDGDSIPDRLDNDTDNDGVHNDLDQCDFTLPAFRDLTQQDTDKDGCHDDQEDDTVPGVMNLTAIPGMAQMTLYWVNPDALISSTNASWTEADNSDGSHGVQGNGTSMIIDNLVDEVNYTFFLTSYYATGGTSKPAINITAQTGANHDKDLLADSLDADDDNDGINDMADSCQYSVNPSFVSISNLSDAAVNDIDGDGCEDALEDSLPGVDNITVQSKFDTVNLTWDLPTAYQQQIDAVRVYYTNNTDSSATDRVAGEVNLGSSATSVVLNQTQLVSKQGDVYSFRIGVVYKSNYENISAAIESFINPDDDGDTVLDDEDSCPRSVIAIGWMSDAMEDTDSDGCRDRDEDDMLVGVTNIVGIPGISEVHLHWVNPNVSLSSFNISWRAGGQLHEMLKTDDLSALGDASLPITGLTDEANFTFMIEAIYMNGGRSQPIASIKVQTGSNYDNDFLADSLDDDDDSDGISDGADSCARPMVRIHWQSNQTVDTDGDGCRDRDEDTMLVGVTNITGIPGRSEVHLQWVNPNVSLDSFNISWREVRTGGQYGEIQKIDEESPLGSASLQITGLADEANFTFMIEAIYENGGRSQPIPSITLWVGTNYDNDSLADSQDPDDDNDGIPDVAMDNSVADECRLSINRQFIAKTNVMDSDVNDIDADGCEDTVEDSLPGVDNFVSQSNFDDVFLSWDLPTETIYQDGIDSIIVFYTNNTNASATDRVVGSVDLMDTTAKNTTLAEDKLMSPQGDDYHFTINVTYKSGFVNTSITISGMIDPDDDKDGVNDFRADGSILDECRLSKPLSGNRKFVSISDVTNSSVNDIDADGCRDVGEDSLPGVDNFVAQSNFDDVFLSWDLPVETIYQRGIDTIMVFYTNNTDVSATDRVVGSVDLMDPTAINTTLAEDKLMSPQGDVYYFNISIIYKSKYENRSGEVMSFINPDDDGDHVNDFRADGSILDECRLSENVTFQSTSDLSDSNVNDIDANGCQDVIEDSLPGVDNFQAQSNFDDVFLSWDLPVETIYQNGIDTIVVFYTNNTNASATDRVVGSVDLMDPTATNITLAEDKLMSPQGDVYYFNISVIYKSKYENRSGEVTSMIDPDDDKDGVNDFHADGSILDECRLSKPLSGNRKFVSISDVTNSSVNDIDADGCRDVGEDSLPGVANIQAQSNFDNVSLSWDLPVETIYQDGIASITVLYTNNTNSSAVGRVSGMANVNLMKSATSLVLTQAQLASPQGDVYYFNISVIYFSHYENRSGEVMSFINPDDDNDSILDVMDHCPRSLIAIGWKSNSTVDTDADGCRDRDEDTMLIGVTNLIGIPGISEVHLHWTNPNVPLDSFNISWEGPNNQLDETLKKNELLAAGSASLWIRGLDDEANYTFMVEALYTNGGRSQPIANITLQTGRNYDNDTLADSVDPDDDNDDIPDDVDSCTRPMIRILWHSNRSVDTDGDGCRDRDEDDMLAGVTNLVGIPGVSEVHLHWINPNVSLSSFNISWEGPNNQLDETLKKNERLALGSASLWITGLDDEANYTFMVEALYTNGGRSQPITNITLQTGSNYDNDSLADSVDDDDDNDDIADRMDSCHFSVRKGFVSNSNVTSALVNDIDVNGCEDVLEDSLPGVDNFVSQSNFDDVFLSWDLPTETIYQDGIDSIIVFYTNNTNASATDRVVGSVDLMDTTAKNTTLAEDKLMSPQGDDYHFTINVTYKSGFVNTSITISGMIDPDDDKDGVNDFHADGSILDECRLSKPLSGNRKFVSISDVTNSSVNDIDADGCRDVGEDSLPGVDNFVAQSNFDDVFLSWDLPVETIYQRGIDTIMVFYTNNTDVSATDRVVGSVDLMDPTAINTTLAEDKLMSPQGDVYYFNISIIYKSKYENRSGEETSMIDPDDDNDGVDDFRADGSILDECRQSKRLSGNRKFVSISDVTNSSVNDIDADGCRDVGEDSLPGVDNFVAQSNSDSVFLSWDLPVETIYQQGIKDIIVFYTNVTDQVTRSIGLGKSAINRTLRSDILTSPPGNTYSFNIGVVYWSGYENISAAIISQIQVGMDSDGDGIGDGADQCDPSSNLTFVSISDITKSNVNDIDMNGCQDGVEDSLPGVTNITAQSNINNITLSWHLPSATYQRGIKEMKLFYTNDTNPLATNIREGEIDLNTLATNIVLTLTELMQEDEYSFNIKVVYFSNVDTTSAAVKGILDLDPDNDGIKGELDQCPRGQSGWTSNSTTDIDMDGCQDGVEDSLPGVDNFVAQSNFDDVFLSWDLPVKTIYQQGIDQIIVFYTNDTNDLATDRVVGSVDLMDPSATNTTLMEDRLMSPQGDEYHFSISVIYKSKYENRSGEETSMIDPDDDNDGINDFYTNGSIWDKCRLSQNRPSFQSISDITNIRVNDIDADGCEDMVEDSLPGVTNIQAQSNPDNVFLSWDLPMETIYQQGIERIIVLYTNNTNSSAVGRVSGRVIFIGATATNITLGTDELTSPPGDVYSFNIVVTYKSGAVTRSAAIESRIDPDGDGDGVEGLADLCQPSQNAGTFESISDVTNSSVNDIDADGCEDKVEDSLPGVTNLTAQSTPKNITLSWILPPQPYQQGIEEIKLHYANDMNPFAANRIEGEIMLMDRFATSIVLTRADLSPLTDEYFFNITVSYLSGADNTSGIVMGMLENFDADRDGFDNAADNCPLIANSNQLDTDNDNIGDACDSDKDGDRLIEIDYIEDLVKLRDDLNGDGIDDGAIATINGSAGQGCPLSGCHGYELARDLDFRNAGSYRSSGINSQWLEGDGWIPIGSSQSQAYSGIFDGNSHSLSNLWINTTTVDDRGLFGWINGGTVQNLKMINATVRGRNSVAILSGQSENSILHNISLQGDVLGLGENVGGMVGQADNVIISYASFSSGLISGDINQFYVGGLVGWVINSQIIASYVDNATIRGGTTVGGLTNGDVGSIIATSYVKHSVVNGSTGVGGLVGQFYANTKILSSYVTADSQVIGNSLVGGLAGDVDGGSVIFSYAAAAITANTPTGIGGLVGGNPFTPPVIDASYWDTDTSGISTSTYGTGQTTSALVTPIDFTDIYSNWDDATSVDNRSIWCDENNDGVISTSEGRNDNLVWDFGDATQYPALTCPLSGLDSQRR